MKKYWSRDVTENSHALDLEPSVFSRSAIEIARSLKRSAERSRNRKGSPFRSAMSMLTFFENRAGKTLSAARRRKLAQAKAELRSLFGRPPTRAARPRRRASKKRTTRRAGGASKKRTTRRAGGASKKRATRRAARPRAR
ncbi:MAG TPA: DUF3175 domain-containing protein [Polyangiaceae bacterium]|nr:DUF3175 domain-containing protein [Polyangiaceae bacterium]